MRPIVIAGNWKMNKDATAAVALIEGIVRSLEGAALPERVRIVVCPPFTSLSRVADLLAGSGIALGAQNMHEGSEGAFTGEISASMLLAEGCTRVILGHSERRQYFHETDEWINKKVRKALEAGLAPIVCVGETKDERLAGTTNEVAGKQTRGVLAGLSTEEARRCIIAYEPVWAIGTGLNATSEQAQEVHAFIRDLLAELYDRGVAEAIPILYGGSLKPENAQTLLSQPDVDGGLIGGASLNADQFVSVITTAAEIAASQP